MTSPMFFSSPDAFRNWLSGNAAKSNELLVGFYKVGSDRPSISWHESVDEALCFGWIDGVRRRIDDQSYSIRFTPRKTTSIWSAVNIAKVEKLKAQGRMQLSGLEAFEHRKDHKSSIYAYEQKSAAVLSAHETKIFKQSKVAWAFFESTPPSYKQVMLHWVTTAKKAATRASRLATLVEACQSSKRLR